MKALERALEPSRRAASGEGPNTGIPAVRKRGTGACARGGREEKRKRRLDQ